ncbi:hypothetical protein QN277_009326 [Acacia crassicarpa]|uniref:Uncharacterized protein n=1 Tax=Acacia crassicarpa TaxID=499986 RepID=A0AAE1ISN1_9FABA|nr:hypothetical protein QN277_009326 [Acacia crassicarpa]
MPSTTFPPLVGYHIIQRKQPVGGNAPITTISREELIRGNNAYMSVLNMTQSSYFFGNGKSIKFIENLQLKFHCAFNMNNIILDVPLFCNPQGKTLSWIICHSKVTSTSKYQTPSENLTTQKNPIKHHVGENCNAREWNV